MREASPTVFGDPLLAEAGPQQRTGSIIIWGPTQVEDGLDKTIEVLVERFSKDYLDANPEDQVSEPVLDEN